MIKLMYIFLPFVFFTSFKLHAEHDNVPKNNIITVEKNHKTQLPLSLNVVLQKIKLFISSHTFFTVRFLISLWLCFFNFIAKRMVEKDIKYLIPLWRITRIPQLFLSKENWYWDNKYVEDTKRIFILGLLIKYIGSLGWGWRDKDWENIPFSNAITQEVLLPFLGCLFFSAIDTGFLTNTYNFLEKKTEENFFELIDVYDTKITKYYDFDLLFQNEELVPKLIEQKRFKFLKHLVDQGVITSNNYSYSSHSKIVMTLPDFLSHLDSIDSWDDIQDLIFSLIEKRFFDTKLTPEYYLDLFLKMASQIPSKREEILKLCFQSMGNDFLEKRLREGNIFLFYDMALMNEKTVIECYETWEYFFDEYIVHTLDKNSFKDGNNLFHIFFDSLKDKKSRLMLGIEDSFDSLLLDIYKKTLTRLREYYEIKNYDWRGAKSSKNETASQHLLNVAKEGSFKEKRYFFIKLFDFFVTDKNLVDQEGKTFLHHVCIKTKNNKENEPCIEILKQLLNFGCQVNVLDKNGCYPLDYVDLNNHSLKNCLVQNGAISKGYDLLFGLDQFSNNTTDFKKQLIKLLINHADENPSIEYKDRIVNMYPEVYFKKENNDLIIKYFMQYHVEINEKNQLWEKAEKELHIVNKYLIFLNPYSTYYGDLSKMYGDWLLRIIKKGIEEIENKSQSDYLGTIFNWFIENKYTCDFEQTDENGANVFHILATSGLRWHFEKIINLPNYDPKKTYEALTCCYNKQKLEDKNFSQNQDSTPLNILDNQIKLSSVSIDHTRLKILMKEKIDKLLPIK